MAEATFLGYTHFYNNNGEAVAFIPTVAIDVEYPNSSIIRINLDGVDLANLDFSKAGASYLSEVVPDNPNSELNDSVVIKTETEPFLFIAKANASLPSTPIYILGGYRATSNATTLSSAERDTAYGDSIKTVILFNRHYGNYVFVSTDTDNPNQLYQNIAEKLTNEPVVTNAGTISSSPAPSVPTPDNFYIEPNHNYVRQGDEIQFTAYADGEVLNGVQWSLHETDSTQEETELNGVTITQTGLMTVNELTMSKWYVKAKFSFTDTTLSTYVSVYNINAPFGPAGPSGPGGTPGTGNPGGGPSGPGTGTLVPNGSNNPNVASGGTFTMYAANMGTLQGLGAWLYSSNFFDAVGRDIMSSLWNSPIEGIISVTAFPFGVPASANVPENIKFGSLEIPISLPVLQNSSYQINWGSVSIEPTWNSFLDYAPHTKIELYLPFATGFVTLDPNDVMGGTVSVVTNIDLIKGTCAHIVSSKYGVIGTYGGVCGLQIPVSGIDTAGKALNLLVSGVTTAVSAGAGAIAGGTKIAAGITETNTTNRVLSGIKTSLDMPLSEAKDIAGKVGASVAKPLLDASKKYNSIASRTAGVAGQTAISAFRTPASVQRSGSFATNGGGLGPTTPFIIFSCPDVNIPANYGHFYGYPLNATMRIGDLKGYSEITGVHLNNVPAMVPELDEISSLLEGGVIL